MTKITRRSFLGSSAALPALMGTPGFGSPSKMGVVYATGSKLIRRVIVPDSDRDLARSDFLGAGESILVVPIGNPFDTSGLQKLVLDLHGLDIVPCGRCAVIDGHGDVVNVIMADPEIDSVAGHRLVTSETADVGWRYDGCGFHARLVVAGADGVVTRVLWHPEDKQLVLEPGVSAAAHSSACVGDVMASLKRTAAPSSGTRQL